MTMPTADIQNEESGFSVVELVIAITIIAIGVTSATMTLANTEITHRGLKERQIAIQGAQDFIDSVRTKDFSSVLPSFRPGGTPGPTFQVPIFEETTNGRIDFFVNETLTDADLPMPLGFPRDLDGDGLISNTDTSLTAQVLVGVVTISWGRADGLQFWRVPVIIRKSS